MKNVLTLGLVLTLTLAANAQEKTKQAAEKTESAVVTTAKKADAKAREIHHKKVAATKKVRKDLDKTAAKVENDAAQSVKSK